MWKMLYLILLASFIFNGCVTDSKYSVDRSIDKFNDNAVTVMMQGGKFETDATGMAYAAEFTPMLTLKEGKIETLAIYFYYCRATIYTNEDYINIIPGSKLIFLIDGSDKVTLIAVTKGSIDLDLTSNQYSSLKKDSGIFPVTPDQLKKITEAKTIEARVTGVTSIIDFPRLPNFHLSTSFLPNIKRFYDTEIAPYSN